WTSVLPSSVTSGPSPPAAALWKVVATCGQGTYLISTSVSGCSALKSASTASRNSVCSGVPSPIIQTLSFAGDSPSASSPSPPPQAAAARTIAAAAAATL